MIDKLEVTIECGQPWSREVHGLICELRSPRPAIPFRTNRYYQAVVDLREVMGLDAILHLQGRGKGDSKLEILHSGEKFWDQMMSMIARVTDEHPEELDVRRLDLCANVEGVGIDWFVGSLRAQWKRKQWQYGEITLDGERVDLMEISGRKVESIQLGMRPNPVRVYDKVAERRHVYERERQRHFRRAGKLVSQDGVGTSADFQRAHEEALNDSQATKAHRERRKQIRQHAETAFPFPTFEEWSGLTEDTILTRVERQMSGRVPPSLTKVRDVRKNVIEFNPFSRLRFPPGETVIQLDELKRCYSPIEILAGLQMIELLRRGEWTYHEMYQFLNMRRNGRVYEKKFARFLAAGRLEQGISDQQLYESYRESVMRQLAA